MTPEPESALTVPEMFRIAHAFHGGSRFAEGSDVFVVMSRVAPLHRIQGLFGSRGEAEAAMRERVSGWAEDELSRREIFRVKAPPHSHEWAGKPTGPSFGDIEALQLRVKAKKGRWWKYDLPTTTDMITLTPAAYHVFLYSYYLDHFGKKYADERLRLVSGGATAGEPGMEKTSSSMMSGDVAGASLRGGEVSPYKTVIAHNDWTEDESIKAQLE